MPSAANQPPTTGQAPPTDGGSLSTREGALLEALQVLRKRKWILVGCVILGILYGLYEASNQTVMYTASGRIEVRTVSTGETSATAGAAQSNSLDTETLIITSDSVLLNVAKEMNLANSPDFMGFVGPQPYRDINDPAVRFLVVNRLAASLQVQLLPRTNLIRITCVTAKPQLAADIVNHVINAYIQRSYEARFTSTQRISQWLQGQMDDLKQQVEDSQEQLIDLQRQMGVLGLNMDPTRSPTTQIAASMDTLSGAVNNAKVARILAESRYRVLNSADPNMLESTLDASGVDGGLGSLRAQAAGDRATLAQDMVTLGPQHPAVLALKAHLAELDKEMKIQQARMVAQSKQALVAAQANEQQTINALEEQKNAAYKMRDTMVEYSLRQREYEANRTLYENLLSRLRAASVQAGLDSMEIDIVDSAYRPVTLTTASRSSIITRTATIALVIGVIIAFTLESLDTGIRSVAEIEQVTGLPSLAVIPRVRRVSSEMTGSMTVAQSNIGVLSTSKSQFSEAFRSLRTALLLSTTGHPPKIILISSSTPTEGKTTVATNLAAIMAQRETKVLLIDGDLRRPNVHHRFGLNGRVGLSSVLSGGSSLDEAIRTVPEIPNLDVLCSGPVPPFPTEMLSSEAMHDLLRQCANRYTHVVLDSPPVLSVTDAIILARQADAIVLVVRHGKSSRNALKRARDLLVRSGAVLTGVVLNSVDITSPEYHGYYGYSGYSYSNIDSESWETDRNSGGNGSGNSGRTTGEV